MHIACIVCMCIHVYTCECMFVSIYMHIFQSVCAMYCMYCMYEHACGMYCMHWPRRALIPSRQARNIFQHGGNPRTPLRAPMGSSPFILTRNQGHMHWPVLAHSCALHAWGGAKQPHRAAHGPSTHKWHSTSPSWAPSNRIWVSKAWHRSRVCSQQHLKPPTRPWLFWYVCACMCMYINVFVCIYMYLKYMCSGPSHCMYVRV